MLRSMPRSTMREIPIIGFRMEARKTYLHQNMEDQKQKLVHCLENNDLWEEMASLSYTLRYLGHSQEKVIDFYMRPNTHHLNLVVK